LIAQLASEGDLVVVLERRDRSENMVWQVLDIARTDDIKDCEGEAVVQQPKVKVVLAGTVRFQVVDLCGNYSASKRRCSSIPRGCI